MDHLENRSHRKKTHFKNQSLRKWLTWIIFRIFLFQFHFQNLDFKKSATSKSKSLRKELTSKIGNLKNGPRKNALIFELITFKMGRFEINHLEEMVTLKNGEFRKVCHFEIDHFEKWIPLKSISSKWIIFEVIYFELTQSLKGSNPKWLFIRSESFFKVTHSSKWFILMSRIHQSETFCEIESLILMFDLGSTDTIIIFVENYFREHLAWAVFVTISPVLSQSVCLENRKHFRNYEFESDIEMKLFRTKLDLESILDPRNSRFLIRFMQQVWARW